MKYIEQVWVICDSLKEAHRLYKRAIKDLCFEIKSAKETPVYTVEFDDARLYFVDSHGWNTKYRFGTIGVTTSYGWLFEMALDNYIKSKEKGEKERR
jgi:hypothetical protein